ncbi:hypothetical protein [Streptomyces ipomoeae]|uniref:hypothetical protein n=1 Tax=Streptomyces ipomoeae TaxID=103232 RepID=UPI001F3CF952|nr:hypothetical protein [Streptomyces ipomoeae]MDX2699194.1 hypothetical protein [Streptomyces ipomoeae]MDX2842400.1 hypothetical protein [Streptomyces ipomoeae]
MPFGPLLGEVQRAAALFVPQGDIRLALPQCVRRVVGPGSRRQHQRGEPAA